MLMLLVVGVGECWAESLAEWNTIYATWNSNNSSVNTLPTEMTKKAYVISSPRGTLFTSSEVTSDYLLSNIMKTAYHTSSTSADFQFLLYPTGNTNGYYVYSVGLKKFVGSHDGQKVKMVNSPVEQFLYKHGKQEQNQGTGVSPQPSFNYADFPFSFSHANNIVGQTIIVSNWSKDDNNIYGTRGGATGYDAGNVYKIVEVGDVSDEIYSEFLSKLGIVEWTAKIVNTTGSGDYSLVYNSQNYADNATFMAVNSLSPTDVTTNCTDKFVWGPFIDRENHTVTFEIRSVASTLTSGRFYQVEIKPETSGILGGTSQADLISTINNNIKTGGHKSNYIYLQCADSPSNRSDYRSILNYEGYAGIPYKSYIYVLNVADNNSLTMQHVNGKYVDYEGKQSDVSSIITSNPMTKQSDNSFIWNYLGAWVLNDNDITPYIGRSSNNTNTMQTFFHPVSTGEDYDIYKVMNAGTVSYNGSAQAMVFNGGKKMDTNEAQMGWYIFLPKGTSVTSTDFLLDGAAVTDLTATPNDGVLELTLTEHVTEISSLSEMTEANGKYVLTADCVASGTILENFSGRLDGNYHKITGLTSALFGTLNNGTVKNIILEDVNISGTTVGAIANTATGNSRVYNCGILSGIVNGNTEAGSIVGRLEGNARVINCYSYADVSGGTVAGIVGNNAGTSATQGTVFNGGGTLVMNCAYFGKLSGTNVYPVFGGNDINNVGGVNTYNYYIYDASLSYASPNSAQGTEETSYFNRFDFYRSILNSHKQLAAMYIFGNEDVTEEQLGEIAHWKYDSNVAEYLSQEPWPVNTKRTIDRTIPVTDEAYKGKNVGEVNATFVINGTSTTVTLPLTDMDTDRWDYTYGKVVLPFANEFSGWSLPESGSTAYDNIITGWEVTSITGGTAGTFSNYDLCDPDCTAKDLYSNSRYVWAQGGNFVVPKGVTAITFTAHVARAVYLRDTHPDISYSENYSVRTILGSQVSGTYNGKTVYNSMDAAFAQLEAKTNPADQAIVLVGNYHLNKEFYQSTTVTRYAAKAVTFMSIDADNNQEPDYCLYQFNTQGSGRVSMPPVRFDFLALPGFGMASYTKGGYIAEMGIIHSKGWLETTETATLAMTEFEMRPQYFSQASPVILNGGIFSKIIMTSNNEYLAETSNLLYTKIGGKAYVNSLNLGRASDISTSTSLALHPLNVSGGEIINCHLTGAVHNGVTSGNAYFYCNGGYIHEFNGAYQERLNGDMIAKMDHVLIDEFYGGGADDAYNDAQITGNINITCNNSYIKFFCGGPKFGNMATGKTVTVNATGSTFDEYYGASYGGTAITTGTAQSGGVNFSDSEILFNLPWSNYTTQRLRKQSLGIAVDFDIDFFQYAGGGKNSGNQSFYVKYASLSLAKTGSVTSTMTDCTFNSHFFGGGCRGMVDGDVTSTLTDCIVKGNAYGGGYTPTATECMVYPTTQPTYPVYKGLYGLFTKYVRTAESEAYHWVQADADHAAGTVDETNKLLYTGVDMSKMGEITGDTSLTIKGTNTVIEGDVFGGGAESKVLGNTSVVIGEQPQP